MEVRMLLEASENSTVTDDKTARTVWGLDTLRLHDHYWAAQGVQVIRPGDLAPVLPNAVAFLLLNRGVTALFAPEMATNRQQWLRSDFLYLRLHTAKQFRERIVTDEADRFVRFERLYHGEAAPRLSRVILTYDPRMAAMWQVATDANAAARNLRKVVPRDRRATVSAMGGLYD